MSSETSGVRVTPSAVASTRYRPSVVGTTTTAGDGNYTFSSLSTGTYSVRVTAPAGLAPTYDLDGIGTANVASFSLAPGQSLVLSIPHEIGMQPSSVELRREGDQVVVEKSARVD